MKYRLACLVLSLTGILSGSVSLAADEPSRFEFNRLIAHWDAYGDDKDYLSFVEECRPQIAQVGFYGAHFWSLSHTDQYAGYPSHFPVQGLNECGEWFKRFNGEIHQRDAKVVGHMNVKFLIGDIEGPDGPRGFFKFYNDLWDETELGPKPVADPRDFLERDAEGKFRRDANYAIGGMGEYWACLNNPHWKTILKAWTKRGIERGVDGYMINYFYRGNCLCEHCQKGFHDYLAERFSPDELKQKFEIADLDNHTFTEIVSWHDPAESTPLRREMLRFSQVSNKQTFDEVFVDYGKSIKPDLLVAQWNHLGDFNQINGDERCLIPGDLWGRGEDYLWYSTGGAAFYTDLKNKFLGDATLQCRYIRGTFDDKPYTLGKYEHCRNRNAISELAANGGAPMGFYARFTDPIARGVFNEYFGFLRKYDDLYNANTSHAEVLLMYPRTAVHLANTDAVDRFKAVGRKLLDDHILFDVRPDDLPTEGLAEKYKYIVTIDNPDGLTAGEKASLTQIEAPYTVRASASRPMNGNEIDVHLVNYNREEPEDPKTSGTGTVDEKPIAVGGITVSLVLPEGAKVKRVEMITPEVAEAVSIDSTTANGRVSFTVPEFLVYGVVRVGLE
ncbi:MAG: hypothetical protein O2955_14895 [Planctomycetota bacterium]|nr:hypothetical protein [Planctomycetota bacterium]